MKTKSFEFPFIGYDYAREHGWKMDVLIGQYGNPIIGIRIKNIVEQYSADPDRYEQFHTVLNQVIANILYRKWTSSLKKDIQLKRKRPFCNKNTLSTLTDVSLKP